MLKSAAFAVGSLTLAPGALLATPGELLRPVAGPPARENRFRGLKVGVASYTFRKQTVDATIKAIQRVGLTFVSIKDFHLPMKSTTEERKAVAGKFREAGITPISCGVVTLPNDEAVCRNAFEYTRDIGAPTMVCAFKPEVLPMLDKLVKEFDIKLAIHNHGPEDKTFPSPYEPFKAIEKFDARIGLCIDVGHSFRAKADPAKAIRDTRSRLYDIHFKDVTPLGGKTPPTEIEVGRGAMDIKSMVQALVEIKYTGHVGFEHERNADDPLPGLAESVGYTSGVVDGLV